MHDYRSNWNEPFSPLGPAIKPKQEVSPPVDHLQVFECVSFDLEPAKLRAKAAFLSYIARPSLTWNS